MPLNCRWLQPNSSLRACTRTNASGATKSVYSPQVKNRAGRNHRWSAATSLTADVDRLIKDACLSRTGANRHAQILRSAKRKDASLRMTICEVHSLHQVRSRSRWRDEHGRAAQCALRLSSAKRLSAAVHELL